MIRLANINDVEAIRGIFNHAIIHTTAVYSYKPYTSAMMLDWFNDKQSKNLPLLVFVVDEIVVAFATYGAFRLRPAYQFTAEHSVYVHHNFRKRGIAKQLMIRLIEIAKSNQIHSLIGGIDAENVGSADFHINLGFKEVALIKEVGYKFNRWLDLKFFQLILDTDNRP